MENKTHYRNVFKSDHLGVIDLEEFIEDGRRLVFTIKHVKQEFNVRVAGKKGNHNIAYFKEDIKPWVINAKNSVIIRKFNNNSTFVQDWGNTIVELYIDPTVKYQGEIVGGIRVKPSQPKLTKPEITKNSPKWKDAVAYYKKNKSFDGITNHYILSDANQKLIKDEASIS